MDETHVGRCWEVARALLAALSALLVTVRSRHYAVARVHAMNHFVVVEVIWRPDKNQGQQVWVLPMSYPISVRHELFRNVGH